MKNVYDLSIVFKTQACCSDVNKDHSHPSLRANWKKSSGYARPQISSCLCEMSYPT